MRRPVLALDLATRTGWALLTSSGAVRTGWTQFGSDTQVRLQEAEEWLTERLSAIAFDQGELVYERTITHRFRAAIRVASHLEAVLLLVARSWGIPPERIHDVSPKTVKKHATGNGNAGKSAVMVAVNERHGLQITDDNEADSRALLDYFLDLGACG